MTKAYLILQDGTVYEGQSLGALGTVTAELAITADPVGYMAILSAEEFDGKIVVQSFPIIGCYGKITSEAGRSKPSVAGYVVREACDTPSNFRSEGTISEYLEENGVIGIEGIDVRSVKRKNRDHGAVFAMIAPDKNNLEEKIKQLKERAKAHKAKVKK